MTNDASDVVTRVSQIHILMDGKEAPNDLQEPAFLLGVNVKAWVKEALLGHLNVGELHRRRLRACVCGRSCPLQRAPFPVIPPPAHVTRGEERRRLPRFSAQMSFYPIPSFFVMWLKKGPRTGCLAWPGRRRAWADGSV